ncbi:MAG: SDR family oxidoreductase [Lewinellaceae bacterium]|nr:SDR family oxidoreductase [Lewinella sp.]MCB9277553.1 SDR family oxidoreductase [Lewinellaceae bacterium]
MKVLVTGSTGYVGVPLVRRLAEEGFEVHALARTPGKDGEHPGIRTFKGDVLDTDSLEAAVAGCEAVYHLAAYAGVWAKDPDRFRLVNVEGTRNVFNAAAEAGVKRVVVTSTGGVMGHSPADGRAVDEQTYDNPPLASWYEKSKLEAEHLAFSYQEKGMKVVVVNPTRIFGPGPLNESNSVTKLIKQFNDGKWRFIPGDGESVGNYVYLDDVVDGHILAMEKGASGERYILGGTNVSYNQLFSLLREVTGSRQRLFHTPLAPMLLFSRLELLKARLTGKKPLIVPEFVHKLTKNWSMSIDKARKELGYSPMVFEDAVQMTLNWIKQNT